MSGTHIIRRQFLDVEFDGSEADALAIENNLLRLCRYQLGPALEGVLDRLVPVEEYWTIDRLEINAGLFRPENLEQLVEAVRQGVELQLRGRTPRNGSSPRPSTRPPAGIQSKTQSQSLRQAFLYFLETGVLPWWLQLSAAKTFEDIIREAWQQTGERDAEPEAFARALGEKMGSASVRRRLVRQFSPKFLDALLSAVSVDVAAVVREIFSPFAKPALGGQTLPGFAEQIWESAFVSAFAGQPATAAALVNESLKTISLVTRQRYHEKFQQIEARWPELKRDYGPPQGRARAPDPMKTPATKALRHREPAEAAVSHLDLREGIYINCAGTVLLHPFLPRFFEGLGVAEKDKLVRPERALCLLHFLATGQRFAPEYELVLPKVLCNVPLDRAVDSRIEMTTAEEEEAIALLEAVIRHWNALGHTSVDELRGSFLVRPGKLSERDGEFVLQVETRSYDVLLDRLPWGLGLVQLPWMPGILWVEWRF